MKQINLSVTGLFIWSLLLIYFFLAIAIAGLIGALASLSFTSAITILIEMNHLLEHWHDDEVYLVGNESKR